MGRVSRTSAGPPQGPATPGPTFTPEGHRVDTSAGEPSRPAGEEPARRTGRTGEHVHTAALGQDHGGPLVWKPHFAKRPPALLRFAQHPRSQRCRRNTSTHSGALHRPHRAGQGASERAQGHSWHRRASSQGNRHEQEAPRQAAGKLSRLQNWPGCHAASRAGLEQAPSEVGSVLQPQGKARGDLAHFHVRKVRLMATQETQSRTTRTGLRTRTSQDNSRGPVSTTHTPGLSSPGKGSLAFMQSHNAAHFHQMERLGVAWGSRWGDTPRAPHWPESHFLGASQHTRDTAHTTAQDLLATPPTATPPHHSCCFPYFW